MSFIPIEPSALRQLAASRTLFDHHTELMSQTPRFAASMRWQTIGGEDRLCKVDVDGQVHDLGPRSADRAGLLERYLSDQAQWREALAACRVEMRQCENLHRAHGVNRVPRVVVGILNALQHQGLAQFYRVIGTHALYAYEVAAGVSFDPESTATNDVDLLWDVQQRLRLVRELRAAGMSMVQLLQTVDPTFERDEMQKESAMNATGFAVDFLRRQEPAGSEPFSISDVEGDVYPVQAENAQQFLNSPVFEQLVIGIDGSMALMRTVDPRVFVDFKRWMSALPTRDFIKRSRDRRQADAVEQLLEEGRLRSSIP